MLRDLLTERKAMVAYPDEYLESVADKLNTFNVSHIPVVRRHRKIAGGSMTVWPRLLDKANVVIAD